MFASFLDQLRYIAHTRINYLCPSYDMVSLHVPLMHAAAVFQAFESSYYIRYKSHLMNDVIFKYLDNSALTLSVPRPSMKDLHRISLRFNGCKSRGWVKSLTVLPFCMFSDTRLCPHPDPNACGGQCKTNSTNNECKFLIVHRINEVGSNTGWRC